MSFNPGDRVRRIADRFLGMGPGDIGTVVLQDERGVWIKEYTKGGDDEYRHAEYNLELVDSAEHVYDIY